MTKKNVIQLLLIVAVTLVFIFYIKKNFRHIKDIISIRPSYLVALVLLNIANKLCLGFKNKRILKSFHIQLAFKEWFGMAVVNNFYNYLAPKSGTAAVGLYLKNKHKLNYHKYAGVLITTALITIFTSGMVGFTLTLSFHLPSLINKIVFLVLFFGMMSGPLILFLMPRIRLPENGFLEKINEFFEGWNILRKDFKTIAILSGADFLIVLSMAARYFILFRIFSLPVAFIPCVLLSPFNIIGHFATIIPGGYGIKEVMVGAVSTLTNIPFASGILVTLTERVIMMALTFILGPIFSFVLLKNTFEIKKPAYRQAGKGSHDE